MASMDLRAEHRQTQTLSPRLQHAVRLLQMSSLDFAAMVRDKMGQNPFLEPEEGEDGEPSAAPESETAGEDASPPVGEADSLSMEQGDDRDMWHADGPGSTRRAEDGEISAMEMMAVETTLNMHLHEQLNVLPLEPRDRALAQAIVESLDDDGYLRTPLEEVAQVLQLDPPPTPTELNIALKRVQSLDPAGIGARSVAECLQLQLSKIDCEATRLLAERIVSRHLQTLAAKDVNGLAHQLGETPARVEAVCDRIRRLDPRPGWRFGSSHIAYVVPDVLVKRVRGQWTVQLNPAIVPRVRFNHVYAELFQRHRSAQNTEMAGHLQDARWTLRNVEQRFSTILDVAQAIVRRQRHFLEYGPMAMKPLVLREIADEVGIHESTVSRVTNNKYMATPIGVFELKYFFSRAMISANGSACSATAIRGLIKDIIEAERPDRPMSDAEITRQLAQQGLVVARRTVTKYRQMLRIESVERRRRHS
ncbi:RNA polymerase factor sigma-54 [Rubrivivax gelatinosus]|uniref:RNA polymerase sigma-54 factor n=2 Tax=Rubrivivax gelatinosus TaxID=28068 RepID=I0HS71_RUBGI|nr:RNA polymerase factor sigma-54 [Rubrivivax gelatinosus]BAL95858.1 RNA polymerase sigma-54 factor RpoN [Rubrivivax gelatinosus IL144]